MSINKSIIVLEGLSSSGKSSTIEEVLYDDTFNTIYRCKLYHRYGEYNLENLYADFDKIKLHQKQYLEISYKISRIGFYLNEFKKQDEYNVGILDRGLFTAYIEAISKGIEYHEIEPFFNNLIENFRSINFGTFILNRSESTCKSKIQKKIAKIMSKGSYNDEERKRIDFMARRRIERNTKHAKYYDKIDDYDFLLGEKTIIDSDKGKEHRVKALKDFIIKISSNKFN